MSESLGNPTAKLHLPMNEFVDMSTVYNRDYIEEENLDAADVAQVLNDDRTQKPCSLHSLRLFQKTINDYRESGKAVPILVENLQSEWEAYLCSHSADCVQHPRRNIRHHH